jgi:hypothetical protein
MEMACSFICRRLGVPLRSHALAGEECVVQEAKCIGAPGGWRGISCMR